MYVITFSGGLSRNKTIDINEKITKDGIKFQRQVINNVVVYRIPVIDESQFGNYSISYDLATKNCIHSHFLIKVNTEIIKEPIQPFSTYRWLVSGGGLLLGLSNSFFWRHLEMNLKAKVYVRGSVFFERWMLIGAILSCLGLTLFPLEVGLYCNVNLWIKCIAFVIVYGSLFIKNWQTYRVFKDTGDFKESNVKNVGSWWVFLRIGIVLLFEIV
jgi:hypothetical protein